MFNSDKNTVNTKQETSTPQCQYFVVRKKRLCRMTVRPGRQYCGEHEPDPKTEEGENDARIPCPNDPKHTCYASKLQKHLAICNARQLPLPPYIEMNVNAPVEEEPPPKISLSQVPKETMLLLIDKINKLYDKYIKDNIDTLEEQEIHEAVLADFEESGRTESSRRHLRQVSALLRLAERDQLVAANTCYVELGAGKGQLSYYLWRAWGSALRGSRVLLVDRASLRHKRDNKLRPAAGDHHDGSTDGLSAGAICRVRASLEHVVVRRVGAAAGARLVALAKHLCGAATDYALRCVVAGAGAGLVLATCCHHRARRHHLLGAAHLQEIGINAEEFEILLRIVSWATCGDGRSREQRANHQRELNRPDPERSQLNVEDSGDLEPKDRRHNPEKLESIVEDNDEHEPKDRRHNPEKLESIVEDIDEHQPKDRRHSHEKLESVVVDSDEHESKDRRHNPKRLQSSVEDSDKHELKDRRHNPKSLQLNVENSGDHEPKDRRHNPERLQSSVENTDKRGPKDRRNNSESLQLNVEDSGDHEPKDRRHNPERLELSVEERAEVGRRGKLLMDWARAAALRAAGYRARLCRFVPAAVTPENVAIIATKLEPREGATAVYTNGALV